MATARRRHPLLVYQRLYAAWRSPALLIALLCGLLWWLAPPPLDGLLFQVLLPAAGVVALLLYVYALAAPRLTYVECRPTHLLLSTPLYRLAVSYARIRTTRPVLFSLEGVRGSRRWLAAPFAGQTALAVDLRAYPVSRRFLRLWLNEFVVPDDLLGLLLLTPDWMALSRDIEVARTHWKESQRRARPDPHRTSLMPR
jgi:hypothetical protein